MNSAHPPAPLSNHPQRGLTLVELMVALAISLVVVLAATAALLVSRQGFIQVDAASQLRENAKFVESLVQRLAVQAGYRDIAFAATTKPVSTATMSAERPNVFGFNDRDRIGQIASDQASNSERTQDTGKGSDILVLRFQSAASDASGGSTDQALIDCSGHPLPDTMPDRYARYSSVLHIRPSPAPNGEPSLMCSSWTEANDTGTIRTQPLVHGVESFQVLYGVDGITSDPDELATADSVADRYLRADEITVDGDDVLTLERWQRVRSLRIGMVLRAAQGTAFAQAAPQPLYPLGESFAHDDDPGSAFTPSSDTRLRQVVTFTVHLRNPQGDE